MGRRALKQGGGVVCLLALLSGPVQADPCAEGATVKLSDSIVAERLGLSIEVDVANHPLVEDVDFATVAAQEAAIEAALAEILPDGPEALRDAHVLSLYVSVLWLGRAEPSVADLSFTPAYVDVFLPVLERRELPLGAAAMRAFRGSFADWEGAELGVYLVQGWMDRTLRGSLNDAREEARVLLRQSGAEQAEAWRRLAAEAPEVAEMLAQHRAELSDWGRLRFLKDQLLSCLTLDLTSVEGAEAWRALPQAQADLILLERFEEAMFSVEPAQFIADYGHLAPEIQDMFERREMWLFAEAFGRMMELYPRPMPESLEARYEVLEDGDRVTQTELVYEDWIVDPLRRLEAEPLSEVDPNAAVREAMIALARAEGLWPE